MKKVVYLILFLIGIGMTRVSAQNPIPSYNVPVYQYANFQEQNRSGFEVAKDRGKRAVHIVASGTTSSMVTIYVYSLDYQTVYGPYTLFGGSSLTVDIDTREWGVLAESEDHITLDVWIEED